MFQDKGIAIFISAWALCVVRSTDSGNAKASKGGTATDGSRFFMSANSILLRMPVSIK